MTCGSLYVFLIDLLCFFCVSVCMPVFMCLYLCLSVYKSGVTLNNASD